MKFLNLFVAVTTKLYPCEIKDMQLVVDSFVCLIPLVLFTKLNRKRNINFPKPLCFFLTLYTMYRESKTAKSPYFHLRMFFFYRYHRYNMKFVSTITFYLSQTFARQIEVVKNLLKGKVR